PAQLFAWPPALRCRLFRGRALPRLRHCPGDRMFKSILREVVENADGAVASILMGFDGITVDSYASEGSGVDMETVGSEYSQVLAQIRQAAQMLDMGTTSEVAIQAENMT